MKFLPLPWKSPKDNFSTFSLRRGGHYLPPGLLILKMDKKIHIRPFEESDAAPVRAMFITVNRLLAPRELKDAFENYIKSSLLEEIDRISEYYREK